VPIERKVDGFLIVLHLGILPATNIVKLTILRVSENSPIEIDRTLTPRQASFRFWLSVAMALSRFSGFLGLRIECSHFRHSPARFPPHFHSQAGGFCAQKAFGIAVAARVSLGVQGRLALAAQRFTDCLRSNEFHAHSDDRYSRSQFLDGLLVDSFG
jgi:hypothetical protein